MSAQVIHFNRQRAARHALLAALALSIASLFGFDAHAGDDESIPRLVISYSDLDLSNPADADVLYSRLQSAANSVCGPLVVGDLRQVRAQRKCYHQSLASAVEKVDHIAITALFKADKSVKLAERRSRTPARS